MKPPADRRLDLQGPAPTSRRPRRSVTACAGRSSSWRPRSSRSSRRSWPGSFTVSLGHESSHWRTLLILNTSYWYLWALFTPAIIWLSQHFRFERQGLWRAILVHLPSVVIFSLDAHRAMAGVQWWLRADDGPAVRLVVGSPEARAPQFRLGDDDLLDDRRPQPRRPLLPRVARIARCARRSSRPGSSRRSSRRCSSSCTRTSSSTRCTRSRR